MKGSCQATYGTRTIAFELERRERETLAIEVHPDGQVRVKAPHKAPMAVILERIEAHGDWILKQQRTFQGFPPPLPPRRYVSGETYRYLGRQYRLKVTDGGAERARLWRGRLEVETRDPHDSLRVKRLVTNWFRKRARAVFTDQVAACLAKAQPHGITHPGEFELRRMPKRWGSCTREGKLILNPALIAAPKTAIDYVILHELCHTLERNHTAAFYALLGRVLPEWEARRRELNERVETSSSR